MSHDHGALGEGDAKSNNDPTSSHSPFYCEFELPRLTRPGGFLFRRFGCGLLPDLARSLFLRKGFGDCRHLDAEDIGQFCVFECPAGFGCLTRQRQAFPDFGDEVFFVHFAEREQ